MATAKYGNGACLCFRGVFVRHWESSIGPLGGGGGSSVVLYYVVGSTKIYSFGGWRN